ncbi:uncharacterized protein LOC128238952 isoform X2 [Mya arenaria]|uniref:uncharacterized protein LOC128238952 isoform X2 n=1 Tax=Mya arenaria TaxID=6604 RepID=UPI0022E2914C|nr:uncharacterized protein LOC128238952 isoform X2 [Mya arenaria]
MDKRNIQLFCVVILSEYCCLIQNLMYYMECFMSKTGTCPVLSVGKSMREQFKYHFAIAQRKTNWDCFKRYSGLRLLRFKRCDMNVYPLTGILLENHVSAMHFEMSRFLTFQNMEQSDIFATKLAKDGIYYSKHNESLICFHCEKETRLSEKGEWTFHTETCEFKLGEATMNVTSYEDDAGLLFQQQLRESLTRPSSDSSESDESEELQTFLLDEIFQTRASETVHDASSSEDDDDQEFYPGVSMTKPQHREYAIAELRTKSFDHSNWPPDHPVPVQLLAECGLFYVGQMDTVRCFYCNCGFRNWEKNDDPWVEHAHHSPSCTYVIQKRGMSFVKKCKDKTFYERSLWNTPVEITDSNNSSCIDDHQSETVQNRSSSTTRVTETNINLAEKDRKYDRSQSEECPESELNQERSQSKHIFKTPEPAENQVFDEERSQNGSSCLNKETVAGSSGNTRSHEKVSHALASKSEEGFNQNTGVPSSSLIGGIRYKGKMV